MHRIKRHRQYELKLNIVDENFIRPPRQSQRQWLVNRAVTEFCWDLEAIDQLAEKFVPGREQLVFNERDNKSPDADEIMESWQLPIMEKMVNLATKNKGDILEIGYGRGVSAAMIQKRSISSHSIVECVPSIAKQCHQWAEGQSIDNLTVYESRWEEVHQNFTLYDGIFFHTYPMDNEEYAQMVRNSATLAEPFFPVAAKHLKPGGIFTYFSNEIDSLSRTHQRALFEHFREISIQPVKNLNMPADVKDTWWIDQMMVVAAHI